jgi:iron-sulfur cluster assembly protein
MIELTDKAKTEVKRLIQQESDPQNTILRIMVVGGGCSGMSYKLGFEKNTASEKDKITDFKDFKIAIDSKSALFIQGMTLDFSDGLNGKGFIFNNPNAKRSCGCGSSFSA